MNSRERLKTMHKRTAGLVLSIMLLAGCATISRLGAPQFEATGVHSKAAAMTESECLGCHTGGTAGAPIAPRAMLNRKNCIRCHLKTDS